MRHLFTLLAFLIPYNSFAGFFAGTMVSCRGSQMPIELLLRNDEVASPDKEWTGFKRVIGHWFMGSQACSALVLPDNETIIAANHQRFCMAEDGDWGNKQWKVLQDLKAGDWLVTRDGGWIQVAEVREIEELLPCYDITVEKTHTFYVSSHQILAHNVIPIAITISFLIGGGTIEFAGVSVGCAALGVYIGTRLWKRPTSFETPTPQWEDKFRTECFGNENQPSTVGNYGFDVYVDFPQETFVSADKKNNNEAPATGKSDEDRLKGAQAPGKPTEKDGFYPPKNWDGKKVRNPNGPGFGWPDKNGHVWVPTGPEGHPLAHGGPHWDVQDPKTRRHRNIAPGGKEI